MTSLDDLPIRDDLRGHKPYGAPQAPVRYQLNVNENTHPVPQEVVDEVLADLAVALRGVNRYPDREFTALREGLAGYVGGGIRPEQIWAANGSNEVLQHVLQAFGGPGRKVLGFPPTYSMHSMIATGTGSTWVVGERDAAFVISPETVVREIQRHDPDVLFLCAPNNPTGTPLPIETIEAAYEASRGIVLVDEAYAEFARPGARSALDLLAGRPRLLVSRTMSKAFAFAGVRLGYLAADPAVIDALRLVRLPYHLSALTQAAATAALRHAPVMLATVGDIAAQRDRIVAELPALGYTPYPSDSNFVFFGGVDDPNAVFEALFARDILIRDVGIPGHLRVTAGTAEETDYFLRSLAEVTAR